MNAETSTRQCDDCAETNPRLFMVRDDLWVWAIPGPDLLCLTCAEKRLGRPFVKEDFELDLPVNQWVFEAFAARLCK